MGGVLDGGVIPGGAGGDSKGTSGLPVGQEIQAGAPPISPAPPTITNTPEYKINVPGKPGVSPDQNLGEPVNVQNKTEPLPAPAASTPDTAAVFGQPAPSTETSVNPVGQPPASGSEAVNNSLAGEGHDMLEDLIAGQTTVTNEKPVAETSAAPVVTPDLTPATPTASPAALPKEEGNIGDVAASDALKDDQPAATAVDQSEAPVPDFVVTPETNESETALPPAPAGSATPTPFGDQRPTDIMAPPIADVPPVQSDSTRTESVESPEAETAEEILDKVDAGLAKLRAILDKRNSSQSEKGSGEL